MASLHIEKEYDDMLNVLKTNLDMDKKKIVQLSIRYIYKNKINPENIKESDPSVELKTLRKDLIGFIKTQEKEKLDPMIKRMDYIIELLNKTAPVPQTVKAPSEDYAKLVQAYKTLSENHARLVEHIQKVNPTISGSINSLKDELKKINETIDGKLSKKFI